jgi:hypothetical protein
MFSQLLNVKFIIKCMGQHTQMVIDFQPRGPSSENHEWKEFNVCLYSTSIPK